MRRMLTVLAALALAAVSTTASAQAPRYQFYVHGRGGDRTTHSQTQLETYWSPDTGTGSSLTHWASRQWDSDPSRRAIVRRGGYNGERAFHDGDAANVIAAQINQFITDYDIQPGELEVIGHSMGGLVMSWIFNNSWPESAYYNRGILGGSNSRDYGIPDDSSTGVRSSFTIPQSGTVSGSVYAWVDIDHSYRGDLVVVLEHAGRSVTLLNRSGGSANDVRQTFTVSGFEGTAAGGTWTLWVRDLANWDRGDIQHFSMHINTTQGGSACNAETSSTANHCDFRRIREATRIAYTLQTPHTGSEGADALFGEADSSWGNTVANVISFLGLEESNRSADHMRRNRLEYARASGGWMGDAGRTTRIYMIGSDAANGDSGTGMDDDGLLNMAWGGICNHSHIVNSWGLFCGTPWEAGDGLVHDVGGRGQMIRSGAGYGFADSPGYTGTYRSWSRNQYVQGARYDWLTYSGNHNQGRYDQASRSVTDRYRGTTTTYWPGYYIGRYGRDLPTGQATTTTQLATTTTLVAM